MKTQVQQTSTPATHRRTAAQTSRGARSLAGTGRARTAAVRLRDMLTASSGELRLMVCDRSKRRGQDCSLVCIVRWLTVSTKIACLSEHRIDTFEEGGLS